MNKDGQKVSSSSTIEGESKKLNKKDHCHEAQGFELLNLDVPVGMIVCGSSVVI